MKTQGKNGKHANQDAKREAERKYLEIKEKLVVARLKPNKTPADKESIKKLENKVKKAKKDMEFSGENHSQKGKGY
jgi:hypothetical protein